MPDPIYEYVTYASKSDVRPKYQRGEWEQVVRLVSEHQATPCTRASCLGRDCPHKTVGAWSPVQIEGDRLDRNVRAVTMLVADLDHLAPGEDGWVEALRASGLSWVAASSHQHAEEAPRYRLVVPLSRPVDVAEYRRLRAAFLRRLQIPADPKTGDPSRIYFLPTSRADVEAEVEVVLGVPLDVEAELASAPPPPEDPCAPTGDGGAADWLESAGGPPSQADYDRLVAALLALPKRGRGQGSTYQAFCLVFHDYGCGIEDGWPAIAAWNEQCGAPHEPASLERQFYRCAGREHVRPRGWQRGGDLVAGIVAAITRPPEGSWEAELARAHEDVARAVGAKRTSSPEPMFERAEELLARQYPPTRWHVEGLLKRRGYSVLGGRSKIGKSWITKELAVALATGTQAMGHFRVAEPCRVAYFFAEDAGPDVQAQLGALLRGRGLGPEALAGRLILQPRGRQLDVMSDEDLAVLVASVRRLGGVDILIAEPLRNLHGRKESDSDEMALVIRRLLAVERVLECTLMAVQHEGKPGQGQSGRKGGERLRGSSVIYAEADCVLSASPISKTPTQIVNLVEGEVRGARSPEDFAATLDIEDGPGGQAVCARWHVGAPEAPEQAGDPGERADAEALIMEQVERHALATHPTLAPHRARGCSCPPGSFLHAGDMYARGDHKVDAPRRRARPALRALLAAGRLERQGGEHGPLSLPESRVAELRAELDNAARSGRV